MTNKTHLPSLQIRDKSGQWIPRKNVTSCNLYNEETFYSAFTKEVLGAKREVIIYSPFVSKYRADALNHVFYKLSKMNVEIFIFTRPIEEYDRNQQPQVQQVLDRYIELGANVFYLKGSIHEKIAIIDREVLWEGSLNILSQRKSREMMRRITDENSSMQVIQYLGLNRMLADGYRLKYEKLCQNLIENTQRRKNSALKVIVFFSLIALAVWWLSHTLSAIIALNTILAVIRAI